MLKAVIFDFDGILADSEHVQVTKWNNVLKPYQIELSDAEYAQSYAGKPSGSVTPALLKERYPQITLSVEELAQAAVAEFKRLMPISKVEQMPGTLKFLEFCKSQSYKIAVCSGKTQVETALKLETAKLTEWFPVANRISHADADFKAKPAPDMYLCALTKLGVSAAEALVFEDTTSGVVAAKSAGIRVVALPSRYSLNHDFEQADLVFMNGWSDVLQNWQTIKALFEKE